MAGLIEGQGHETGSFAKAETFLQSSYHTLGVTALAILSWADRIPGCAALYNMFIFFLVDE